MGAKFVVDKLDELHSKVFDHTKTNTESFLNKNL